MAEGGHENRGYDLDPGEGGGEEIPMRPMRHDETPFQREEEEEETSFGGRPETEPLLSRERGQSSAWQKILREHPNCDPGGGIFTAGLDKHGKVVVRYLAGRGGQYRLFKEDGGLRVGVPQRIIDALGPTRNEVESRNDQRREVIQEELARLREGAPTEESGRRIRELEAEDERLGEVIEERMSLRDRVKAKFEKYGLTAFAVLSAVGTIIGVIVSDLKSGLTKMSKGIGNGLKDIAKKLAGILPGIVGSLVSFLFKTAGEAIGFLSKHAWLLILLVVTFVVEQFKERGSE